MRDFRFSISGLIAWVVVLAVVFGVARWLILDAWRVFERQVADLVVCGALPMGIVLALGLIPLFASRLNRGGDHPRLVGFEVFGGVALTVLLVAVTIDAGPLHDGVGVILQALSIQRGRVIWMGAVVILLLPQLVVAMLGARWCGKYRVRVSISIEKRQESIRESPPGEGLEPIVQEGPSEALDRGRGRASDSVADRPGHSPSLDAESR